MNERFKIGSVSINRANLSDSLSKIENILSRGRTGYICFMDTRTAYLANRDEKYCKIQSNSLLTLPDAMPLVWYAHNLGYYEVGKASGADFMELVFSVSVKHGYSHYFYGSTPDTIEMIKKNLNNKYQGISILGAVSPPFLPLEKFDINALSIELNRLKPTFFWCGLGAPKQEGFMSLLQPQLQSTICAGVGLAFEYFAGSVQRAPVWMQNTGLEGVYRLAQQPRNVMRIIKPYFWIVKELILSGLKITKA